MAYKNKAEKYLQSQNPDKSPMASLFERKIELPRIPEVDYATSAIDEIVPTSKTEVPYRIPEPFTPFTPEQLAELQKPSTPTVKELVTDPKTLKKKLMVYENPELKMDDINLEGKVDPLTKTVSDMKRAPTSRMAESDLSMLADLVAAGAPTISGLLAGASPSVMMNHYNRQNKYTDIRGKQINPSKENLMVLQDDEGNPYYELANNSRGKTPYYQPKGVNSGAVNQQGEALFQVRNVEDEFGRPKIIGITKSGKQIDLNARPHMGVGQMVFTDPYGNKIYQQYDKGSYYYGDGTTAPKQVPRGVQPSVGGSPFKEPGQPVFGDRQAPLGPKTTGSMKGYGAMTGTPLESMKKADDLVEKYSKDIGEIIKQREDLAALEPILRNPNATAREQAVVIQALVQASTVETKMTNEDVDRVTGANLRPLINDLTDLISRKGIGGLSAYERENAIKTANTLIKKSNKIEQFFRNKLVQRAEGIPGAKKYIEGQGFTQKTESTKKVESTLNKARELAKKKFPNDPKMQEEFIKYAEGQL